MIVVKIELWSARTGKITEIGRMRISNVGVAGKLRDYAVEIMRRGTTGAVQRTGEVTRYPAESYNVWRLVSRALRSAFPEER